jgi:homoserine kinase type II
MASYTTADDVDLAAVADRYALENIRLTPLSGGAANSSFHLRTAAGEYVLTVLDNHDLSSARRLAVHTQAVFGLGIRTAEILPTVDGDPVAEIGDRPAIVKRWIAALRS